MVEVIPLILSCWKSEWLEHCLQVKIFRCLCNLQHVFMFSKCFILLVSWLVMLGWFESAAADCLTPISNSVATRKEYLCSSVNSHLNVWWVHIWLNPLSRLQWDWSITAKSLTSNVVSNIHVLLYNSQPLLQLDWGRMIVLKPINVGESNESYFQAWR